MCAVSLSQTLEQKLQCLMICTNDNYYSSFITILFSLFIDDLVHEMPAGVKIRLYADDAKLYIIYEPHDWIPCLQLALAILVDCQVGT